MAETERPFLGELQKELSGMADEAAQLASLRWRLAEIELRESAETTRRFAIWAMVCAVLVLSSLPVFVIALSAWLLPSLAWAWISGLILALLGLAAGWFAWRRFRRDFHGLEQSLEELREDLAWVKEWSGKAES